MFSRRRAVEDNTFASEVRQGLGWLVDEHGFSIGTPRITPNLTEVPLESSLVIVRASLDLRGEFDVRARLRDPHAVGEWVYTGTVGAATSARLIEIASEKLRSEPRVIGGDSDYYRGLAVQSDAESRELNRVAQGLPRDTPFRPKLP